MFHSSLLMPEFNGGPTKKRKIISIEIAQRDVSHWTFDVVEYYGSRGTPTLIAIEILFHWSCHRYCITKNTWCKNPNLCETCAKLNFPVMGLCITLTYPPQCDNKLTLKPHSHPTNPQYSSIPHYFPMVHCMTFFTAVAMRIWNNLLKVEMWCHWLWTTSLRIVGQSNILYKGSPKVRHRMKLQFVVGESSLWGHNYLFIPLVPQLHK